MHLKASFAKLFHVEVLAIHLRHRMYDPEKWAGPLTKGQRLRYFALCVLLGLVILAAIFLNT